MFPGRMPIPSSFSHSFMEWNEAAAEDFERALPELFPVLGLRPPPQGHRAPVGFLFKSRCVWWGNMGASCSGVGMCNGPGRFGTLGHPRLEQQTLITVWGQFEFWLPNSRHKTWDLIAKSSFTVKSQQVFYKSWIFQVFDTVNRFPHLRCFTCSGLLWLCVAWK